MLGPARPQASAWQCLKFHVGLIRLLRTWALKRLALAVERGVLQGWVGHTGDIQGSWRELPLAEMPLRVWGGPDSHPRLWSLFSRPPDWCKCLYVFKIPPSRAAGGHLPPFLLVVYGHGSWGGGCMDKEGEVRENPENSLSQDPLLLEPSYCFLGP